MNIRNKICIIMILIMLVSLFNFSYVFASDSERLIISDIYEFDSNGIHYKTKIVVDNKNMRIVETETSDGYVSRAVYNKISNTLALQELVNETKKEETKTFKNLVKIDLNKKLNKETIGIKGSIYEEASFWGEYVYFKEIRASKIFYELTIPTDNTVNTPDVAGSDSTKEEIRWQAEYFLDQLETGRTATESVGSAVLGSIPGAGTLFSVGSIVEDLGSTVSDPNASNIGNLVISGLEAIFGPASTFYSAADAAASGSVAVANFYNCRVCHENVEDLIDEL